MNRNTKRERIARFYGRLAEMGFTYEESEQLRRIELTLRRWAERECGDGSNWGLERDEQAGKPYMVWHGEGKPRRYPTADREAGALRRLAKLMAGHPEWVSCHQGDPRGCALYLIAKRDLEPSPSESAKLAREHGAKLHIRSIEGRKPSACWVVLDQPQASLLWSAAFETEREAAETFLAAHLIPFTPERTLRADAYYTRGFAVCI